jgi:hypothetical protein
MRTFLDFVQMYESSDPDEHARPHERVDPYKDLEFLKLSNKVLRAYPSSPRQKELKDKLRERARALGAHWWADGYR